MIEQRILFLPTKSLIVFNKKQARDLISEKFFPIKDVVIRKKLFHKLLVIVQEKKANAAFCSENNCYFVDQNGYAFFPIRLENLSSDTAVAMTERNIRLRDKVADKQILNFFLVNEDLNKHSIKIKEFRVFPGKIEAKTADSGALIYFDPFKSPELQVEDLVLVLENQIPSQDLKNLDYIDLRFDKIFYKFK